MYRRRISETPDSYGSQSLADSGKLVHAYEVLADLLSSAGVNLTDDERTKALSLSNSVNRRIRTLDSFEVSLQKADYALSGDDLRSAMHHAGAVLSSGTSRRGSSALRRRSRSR